MIDINGAKKFIDIFWIKLEPAKTACIFHGSMTYSKKLYLKVPTTNSMVLISSCGLT